MTANAPTPADIRTTIRASLVKQVEALLNVINTLMRAEAARCAAAAAAETLTIVRCADSRPA